MQEAARAQGAELNIESANHIDDQEDDESDAAGDGQKRAAIDEASRQRIEQLFQAADRDRSQAVGLKQELDRLGVFRQYEDRFLDLFKKAD
jgi:hypothetical protein